MRSRSLMDSRIISSIAFGNSIQRICGRIHRRKRNHRPTVVEVAVFGAPFFVLKTASSPLLRSNTFLTFSRIISSKAERSSLLSDGSFWSPILCSEDRIVSFVEVEHLPDLFQDYLIKSRAILAIERRFLSFGAPFFVLKTASSPLLRSNTFLTFSRII